MLNSHVVRRTLVIGATAAALIAAAVGSTGCYSHVEAVAPNTTPTVAIGAPTGAQAAEMPGGGMHGNTPPAKTPTSPAAKTPAAPAAKTTPPTAAAVAAGEAVIRKSCLNAGCHTDTLLSYRASQPKATAKVGTMAGRAKVGASQKKAAIAFFTQ